MKNDELVRMLQAVDARLSRAEVSGQLAYADAKLGKANPELIALALDDLRNGATVVKGLMALIGAE